MGGFALASQPALFALKRPGGEAPPGSQTVPAPARRPISGTIWTKPVAREN